jgi:hypothetical protein
VQFDDSQANAITVTANGFIGSPLTLNGSIVVTDNTYSNHSTVLPKGVDISFHGTDTAITSPEGFRTTYVFLGTQGGTVPLSELILRGEPVGNSQERFDGTFIGAGDPNLPAIAPPGSIAITVNPALFVFGSAPNTAGFNVTQLTTLLGDYNGNHIVDAADYTVWRDERDKTGPGLAADGNSDGVVNLQDYSIWHDNFPPPSGSGIGSAIAIPEPSTAALLVIGCVVALVTRRR